MTQVHDIDDLLQEVVTLPSLPTTVTRITDLLDDPNTPMAAVGKAVSADPSLALKTLRLVNSAFHGVREQVTSVDQAVVMLGAKTLRNLVLTASIVDSFENDSGGLLRHSIACGVAMRTLVGCGLTSDTQISNEGDAFVFGLLHDIGKIVLQQFLPDEYARAREISRLHGLRLADAERSTIGADHAEVGARLVQHWRLGDRLAKPIAGHHELDRVDEEYRKLAALLAIADYTAYASGYLPLDGEAFPMLDPDVWTTADVTGQDISRFLEAFFINANQIDELLDVTR